MVKDKGLEVVIKEIKQRVVAPSAKLAKYEAKKRAVFTKQYISEKTTKVVWKTGKGE